MKKIIISTPLSNRLYKRSAYTDRVVELSCARKPFFSITIPEQPIAWKRPSQTKDGRRYDSQSALKERHSWLFKEAMMLAHKNCTNKPLIVQLVFTFLRVKSNKRKHHTSDPDIDNCCKYYLDSMQNVIYLNDNQIIELSAKKLYSVQPSVNIVIFEV
jgi:Holliday junction resolvase RusA-like endonuclease